MLFSSQQGDQDETGKLKYVKKLTHSIKGLILQEI